MTIFLRKLDRELQRCIGLCLIILWYATTSLPKYSTLGSRGEEDGGATLFLQKLWSLRTPIESLSTALWWTALANYIHLHFTLFSHPCRKAFPTARTGVWSALSQRDHWWFRCTQQNAISLSKRCSSASKTNSVAIQVSAAGMQARPMCS